jgi:DNA gyrase subunit A
VVYKKKVYRLPIGTPQARGKALVNLLPLGERERITTVMPMPEDEDSWQELTVMFATASGNVRRNSLSDFMRIQANGKIAMRLAEGEHLVGVTTCTEADDVLLATRRGKCIRFAVADVRVFRGRTATGVRGIRLAAGDEVISMSILRHVEAETEQRDAYLRLASARRRMAGDEATVASCAPEDVADRITPERAAELESQEEFILSIAEDGMGKRSSAYEYRITGRGGKGIDNMDLSRGDDRNPTVVAAFPVHQSHQIILVTDGGQLIRCPVDDVRIAGRRTRGVTLFNVAEDERVVSVTRLEEDEDDDDDDEEEEDNNGDDNGDDDGDDDGDDGGDQGDGDA